MLRYYVSSDPVQLVAPTSPQGPTRLIPANKPFLAVCHADEATQADSSRLVMPDGVVDLTSLHYTSSGIRLAAVTPEERTAESDVIDVMVTSDIHEVQLQVDRHETARCVRRRAAEELKIPQEQP